MIHRVHESGDSSNIAGLISHIRRYGNIGAVTGFFEGIANPLAAILSFEMALRWSLGAPQAANRLYSAVTRALAEGARTPDIGGSLSTAQMGDAVIAKL